MKRLNPSTNSAFKCGDIREDGYVFWGYETKDLKKDGYFSEKWREPKSFKKRVDYNKTKRGHLACYLTGTKRRAKLKGIPFELDLEYLESIAPDNCPVFHTKFNWGMQGKGITPDRPSLDRIIPELGYIKGNVVFISITANRIKSDVTEKELYIVADWLHNERKKAIDALKDRLTFVPTTPDTPGKKHS